MAAPVRAWRPVYIDRYQSDVYTHVLTVLYDDGSLRARFADGREATSVFANVEEMLKVGEADFRERVIEVPIGRCLMFEIERAKIEQAVIGKRIAAIVWDSQDCCDYRAEAGAIVALVLEDGTRIEVSGSANIDDARAFVEVAHA